MSYQYTVAVCNYNMVKTLEESLRSIYNQTGTEFEILVVDGGSTDGSLRLLRELSTELERLRVVNTAEHEPSGLAADRNISVREASGEHVLTQLDTDDYYYRGITEFVTVYEQLRSQIDREFYLKGQNINIGQKDFLEGFGPYRVGLTRGEDRDLWRRLFAENAILWLEHEPISKSIGYDPGILEKVGLEYNRHISDFRSGIEFTSFLRWALENMTTAGFGIHTVLGTVAYFQARRRGVYDLPREYAQMGRLEAAIANGERTLCEIESELDVKIDRCALSDVGTQIFYS